MGVWGGVAAGLDGEFLVAVQDPVVGVLDDDGDEFPGVAGSELDGLAVDHDPAAGDQHVTVALDLCPATGGGAGGCRFESLAAAQEAIDGWVHSDALAGIAFERDTPGAGRGPGVSLPGVPRRSMPGGAGSRLCGSPGRYPRAAAGRGLFRLARRHPR
jgi:hypothetical protein